MSETISLEKLTELFSQQQAALMEQQREAQRIATDELRTALAEEQRTAAERLEKALEEQREEQRTATDELRTALAEQREEQREVPVADPGF